MRSFSNLLAGLKSIHHLEILRIPSFFPCFSDDIREKGNVQNVRLKECYYYKQINNSVLESRLFHLLAKWFGLSKPVNLGWK